VDPAGYGGPGEPALAERIPQAFARGAGHGLLRLGPPELGQVLPPVFAYWRELGSRHVTALCTRPRCRGAARGGPAGPGGRDCARVCDQGRPGWRAYQFQRQVDSPDGHTQYTVVEQITAMVGGSADFMSWQQIGQDNYGFVA